jgi:Tol biopolymer transport system component
VLGVLGASALVAAATGLAIVPGTLPTTTQRTIDNGAGNQTDPHVSGDLAAYTSDVAGTTQTQIRYFDFATGTATGIANDGNVDFLSDVSGTSIVFTRIGSGTQRIMLFDTATGGSPAELDPVAGSQRRGAAIGGGAVGWIDVTSSTVGEVVVHDLSTSTSQQLTSNTLIDRRVAVSPDGNVLVWEQCTTASSCNVAQAVRSGAAWTVGTTASATTADATGPDTNGSIVVYAADRATSVGGSDVYWKSVAGGTEQQLELDGRQRSPNVSGNLIAFESIASGQTNADVLVYEVSTNMLYQLTTTPTLSEALNDVSVTGSTVRVVWAVFEGSEENVYGLTFQLPASYTFTGFLSPVDNLPTLNLVKGGRAIPVKFSLGGDQGLDIFEAAYPKSQQIDCDSSAEVDGIEETVTAGSSSLSYDAATDIYTYVWKTDKAWVGTCRQLVLKLDDGTTHRANFKVN